MARLVRLRAKREGGLTVGAGGVIFLARAKKITL